MNIVIAIILSFSSMIYELSLSQLLNLTLGGTIFQYTITIGIFAASLGIGSLYYQKKHTKIINKSTYLVNLELFLVLFGSLAPFVAIITQSLLVNSVFYWAFSLLCYIIIFIIGFTSGLELPLLMDIDALKSNSYNSKIFSLDFLGTFLACVIFPLFFLPYLFLFQNFFICGLANLLAIYSLISDKMTKIITFFIICIHILLIYYTPNISKFMSLYFN